VGEALCCGYTGFILLDAALRHQQRSLGKTLTPRLYERQTPTYYGMLVASFLPS
jgi:aromatic ring-opening dioxygenase LigB subunit